MAKKQQFDFDSIIAFVKTNELVLALLLVAVLLIGYYIVVYGPAQKSSVVSYSFNYGPVLVYKNVSTENSIHSEKILVSSVDGAKMLSLLVFVPKKISATSDITNALSNGKITALTKENAFKVQAVNKDSISLEYSIEPATGDYCSLIFVTHSSVLQELIDSSNLDSLTQPIITALDNAKTCAEVSALEKQFAEKAYAAATGAAS